MSSFTEDELAMFAAEMSGGELAELMLIDQEMGPVEMSGLPERFEREMRAATAAAASLLDVDVPPGENVVIVDFASRARPPRN